ncbi:TPA: TetR/AcrR family transcriptional regulator [Pseudomonas aeruginosa]|nr:TetR/AcrR family transcriptional regulator [Pseudomonas aeruginosa]HCF2830039.1 TetR/AcrR family transcriptional regulator [Pseudomonas aeruginosa]HCL3885047.1 TetR/AcrR family transcriptional regulator [Pseudomonas aeruginosa]
MRPAKISRDELMTRCSKVFRRYGYHGTTMDTLAAACELTKASFYHHYPNKESLMSDVLQWTHERIDEAVFSLAYEENQPELKRFQGMAKKAKGLFKEDGIGCLMGVIAIDATYALPDLMPQIRSFLDAWAQALAQLFMGIMKKPAALEYARQTVADYEGAILLGRIYGDFSCFDRVTERIQGLFIQ